MLDKMREWINSTGSNKNEILHRLTSDMVKQGKNRRIGDTSATTGHVHNQLLPEGGLQQVIAQQNVHVPGASVLNAGQDLMSGKMVSSNTLLEYLSIEMRDLGLILICSLGTKDLEVVVLMPGVMWIPVILVLHLEGITLRRITILSHPTTLNLPTLTSNPTVVNPLTLLIPKPLTVPRLCPSLISHLLPKITTLSRLMAIKATALVIQGSSIAMTGLVTINHLTMVAMERHLKANMVHHMVGLMVARLIVALTSLMEDLLNLLMGNSLPMEVSLKINGHNALLIRDLQVDGKGVIEEINSF